MDAENFSAAFVIVRPFWYVIKINDFCPLFMTLFGHRRKSVCTTHERLVLLPDHMKSQGKGKRFLNALNFYRISLNYYKLALWVSA
jgi:hypothetical protein